MRQRRDSSMKSNGYFGKAVKDLETVLSINKQAMMAYNLLIGITNARAKMMKAKPLPNQPWQSNRHHIQYGDTT